MNCSNCNVANFKSELNETEKIMCENGHFLCAKCYSLSVTRCVQCGGRLFDCNENIPLNQHYNKWTLDMICEWTKMNEKPTPYSCDNFNGEMGVLKNTDSMKLLFSRSRSLDPESEHNSNALNILSSKWNQTVSENPNKINAQNDFFDREELLYSRNVENSKSTDQSLNLLRKDTRQNLVCQLTEEIRGKMQEQIYNRFKHDPRTSIKPDEFMCIKECKTIGVSTEPTPRIVPRSQSCKGSKEHIVEVIDLKPTNFTEEHVLMNADTSHNMNPEKGEELGVKKPSSGVEQQFQQAIKTVLESGIDSISQETEDNLFMNMLKEKFSKMPQNKIEQIMSSICNTDESKVSDQYETELQGDKPEEQTKHDFALISNSSRASYSPPSCHQIATAPKPQFQLLVTATKPPAQTIDATSLRIPRSPVVCPISSCQQLCFVSDFSRHIAVDHTNVPLERIFPRQCKHFFLDPKLIHFGSTRCQMLLLVMDKIRNLGHEKKFKDFIPVLVMSTKVSTLEMCCNKAKGQFAMTKNIDGGLLMIWLVGLMPTQVPIYFSFTVWARTGKLPSCHIVHSGQLYSIRNSQSTREIQESGQRLLLSPNQVDLLTGNGKNMLELQILIN